MSNRGQMSKSEARALLDAVRGGVDMPLYLVNRALRLTGDLDNDDDELEHQVVQVIRPAGTWERRTTGVLRPAGPFDWLAAA